MADETSQGTRIGDSLFQRFPLLARLKGFANGINPRWWPKTVVVSKSTGDILRLEDLRKKRTQR